MGLLYKNESKYALHREKNSFTALWALLRLISRFYGCLKKRVKLSANVENKGGITGLFMEFNVVKSLFYTSKLTVKLLRHGIKIRVLGAFRKLTRKTPSKIRPLR